MTDPIFTKALGRIISGSKDMYDWGVAEGHLDKGRFCLTIGARRIEAKRLIDSGLSQRQAAKALGVDETTIRRDLGVRQKAAKSAAESRGRSTPESGNGHDEYDDEYDHKVAQRNIRTTLMMNAEMAIKCAEYDGPVDKKVISACRRAANAWNDLADKLEGVNHG